MKEKLQEYALIAEIISALAVVAGLVFVGLQIQQGTEQSALNTRAMETAAYQDLIGQILEINNTYNADRELSDLVDKGVAGELTDPSDESIFAGYALTLLRHADMACFQFQQGILSEERLVSALAIFINQVYLSKQENIRPIMLRTISIAPGLESCINNALTLIQNRVQGL